jgi:hypothetical protein
MWDALVPWLAQGGVTGAIAYIGYRLHKDAVHAHEQRADDWRKAAEAAQARADLKDTQMGILLGRTPDREPTS